jgi:hypothetical protein
VIRNEKHEARVSRASCLCADQLLGIVEMKTINVSFLKYALLSLVCTGCMAQEAPKKDGFPIISAIEKSVSFANGDRVNLANYSRP